MSAVTEKDNQLALVENIDMNLAQLDALLAVASSDEFTAYCPAVQTNYLWNCHNLVKAVTESFEVLVAKEDADTTEAQS